MTAFSSSTANAASPNPPAPLVALGGLLIPGLGFFLIGERARCFIAGGAILITYILGLLIGGVRVIDVPGYGHTGERDNIEIRGVPVWKLKVNFTREVLNKPWYMAQTLVGPVNLVGTWGSLQAAQAGHRQSTARIYDIGTLYTAVAGMLNLLVIIDATYRSTKPKPTEPKPAEPKPVASTSEKPAATPAPSAGASQ